MKKILNNCVRILKEHTKECKISDNNLQEMVFCLFIDKAYTNNPPCIHPRAQIQLIIAILFCFFGIILSNCSFQAILQIVIRQSNLPNDEKIALSDLYIQQCKDTIQFLVTKAFIKHYQPTETVNLQQIFSRKEGEIHLIAKEISQIIKERYIDQPQVLAELRIGIEEYSMPQVWPKVTKSHPQNKNYQNRALNPFVDELWCE